MAKFHQEIFHFLVEFFHATKVFFVLNVKSFLINFAQSNLFIYMSSLHGAIQIISNNGQKHINEPLPELVRLTACCY